MVVLMWVMWMGEGVNFTENMTLNQGFVDYWLDAETASVYLELPSEPVELLYQSSLPQGLGSNDIGLDRGQLADVKYVRLEPIGNKVLMRQLNTTFRAESDNPSERQAVVEAFADSVIWSFPVVDRRGSKLLVNATDFLLRDSHSVADKLRIQGQGQFSLQKDRCALYLPRCKSFPKNTEFEAILTFEGKDPGRFVRQVTPDPNVISLRTHHSFIELPDSNYRPRNHHPQSGYWHLTHYDYAAPLSSSIQKNWIGRHRLEKKNPDAAISDPIEPIVYYVDRGAPEPIRQALIDGASWWSEAFEAAGFSHAFRVELMPEGADPMDVRYNVIQWVHRATRGWSYGMGVTDPRTGEIIKGHVSLGSLRVRQDILIAQGILLPFTNESSGTSQIEAIALARIRQLSAHEVGHTLGLDHNFAASTKDRASVMDYPHPFFELGDDGVIASEDSYAVGIGAWDKRAIIYGYSQMPAAAEPESLKKILIETKELGLEFANDADARNIGSCHPRAHLWDNGSDAIDEMDRIMALRRFALDRFDERSISFGDPMSEMAQVLVPVYLMHRYQLEAVVAQLGGVDYSHSLRGEKRQPPRAVPGSVQRRALTSLMATLTPEFLALSPGLIHAIPPAEPGHPKDRESAPSLQGSTFDPIALAESSVSLTLDGLLEPSRMERMRQQAIRDTSHPGLSGVLTQLVACASQSGGLIEQRLLCTVTKKMIMCYQRNDISPEVRASLFDALHSLKANLGKSRVQSWNSHLIDQALAKDIDIQQLLGVEPPPGSPIGN